MPEQLPDLSGVATQDLVEHIGSGSYKASYINWSRTMELLRKNAPGWMVQTVYATDGSILHKAPVGAYMLIRFRHIDGFTTDEVCQAVMDHRNNSIPYEKITSRDITDTHRRGSCMAAAFTFGLGYELWAKMPLESGYRVADEQTIEKARQEAKATPNIAIKKETPSKSSTDQKDEFIQLAESMGFCKEAIDELLAKVKSNFANGIKTLKGKDEAFVSEMNQKFLAEQY